MPGALPDCSSEGTSARGLTASSEVMYDLPMRLGQPPNDIEPVLADVLGICGIQRQLLPGTGQQCTQSARIALRMLTCNCWAAEC